MPFGGKTWRLPAGLRGFSGVFMVKREFMQRCVALDLEVAKSSERIHKYAAIRGDNAFPPRMFSGKIKLESFDRLDEYTTGAEYLLGHNIISFDLPHLHRAAPGMRLFELPAIDTLWLSPLAFPRHPYHRLVKHYKDGGMVPRRASDPELDARLAMELFADEREAFEKLKGDNPDLLLSYHWLCSRRREDAGFDGFFGDVRGASTPGDEEAAQAITRFLENRACQNAIQKTTSPGNESGWPLAYALAWISAAGSNSVMPPWVRHQFPEAAALVRLLRNAACANPECQWCATHHNAATVLKKWFGFSEFRPTPACADGRPMQRVIVESVMAGKNVLGILPTGTGKSACYQIPALSRYENTGSLTIVISPLVALMADQVAGLEARGISSCAALNGLLSMPERAEVQERTRLGDVSILIVSPEQLRNPGFQKAVAQREIGAWVLDEAHCLSKWGHDFRPDYRYVGRFIRQNANASGMTLLPPVLCLTATAKPDVVRDICGYFKNGLGIEMEVFNGGSNRENLVFDVVGTTPDKKELDIHHLLEDAFGDNNAGGAIIYCSTRKNTEELAKRLCKLGWSADHFHAGLQPETKKNTQRRFIEGELRVIVATNAFGMGIDKPDVRLVVHADIPGSLENYLQEAGRAGRDRAPAQCVLLYCEKDVENQFGLSAQSRLSCAEIQSVNRALQRMAGKKKGEEEAVEVVATPGEILTEDEEGGFTRRDSNNDDTRIRTAISWLEEAHLVSREQNHYEVFPSCLRVSTMAEAERKLTHLQMPYQGQLRSIVQALLEAKPDEGVSTDELMAVARMSSSNIQRALFELQKLGVATNDSAITALVHSGVEHNSKKRLDTAATMEVALIDTMREAAPDLETGMEARLSLRLMSQKLKDGGHAGALPDRLHRLLRSIAGDGRSEEEGKGSIQIRKYDADYLGIVLRREWEALKTTADLRRTASARLLGHLLALVSPGQRGLDLQVATTMGNLHAVLEDDMEVGHQAKDIPRLVERSLLWLHEQEVIRLGRGLVILRPAMTLKVRRGAGAFTLTHYAELAEHYREQVVQIHVMKEYATLGVEDMRSAMGLSEDYFSLERKAFIEKWMGRTAYDLTRQTTPESWNKIVEALNKTQEDIVTDRREQKNMLVLAGPGSGKTKVLAHRIAFLLRVMRENPKGILVLTYNRHAAVEVRVRLRGLVDDDANGVTILTCHALAMRLTGASFVDRTPGNDEFADVIKNAVSLLKGEGLQPEDADEQRDRILSGFRWILVDEYQDMAAEQYELISALAGRTLSEPDRRISLFAVGDDDQNIYSFRGASVAYIQAFKNDYKAEVEYLTENYRSTANIIHTANALMERAENRMKQTAPIIIDEKRRKHPPGGKWQSKDKKGLGRVQILETGASPTIQAEAVMAEILRLSALAPEWNWSEVAVIARNWKYLHPVRAFCEINNIPAMYADEGMPSFYRLRETQELVDKLAAYKQAVVPNARLKKWLKGKPDTVWWGMIRESVDAFLLEYGGEEFLAAQLRDWLAEWGMDAKKKQRGLLLLTAHRAKGLEFKHVAVLDGGWNSADEAEAERRLYYVAMTRARETLLLARMGRGNRYVNGLQDGTHLLRREAVQPAGDVVANLDCIYKTLQMRDIDLSYAGRMKIQDSVHAAIAALNIGDPLTLKQKDSEYFLCDRKGKTIGRLAKNYAPPNDYDWVKASVYAVVVRKREDSQAEYNESLKYDRWEVVIPEMIYQKKSPSA